MKKVLFYSLIIQILFGIFQEAKAYNLEACAKKPFTSIPPTINLLQPIDQKMIDCIPNIDSVSNQWRDKANRILSAINSVRIGNGGENDIEKLEYDTIGNSISFVTKVRAKHTWQVTIPEVKTKVPVDKWRWVKVPYPDVRWHRKCRLGVCVKVPEYFTNYRDEKVPYVVMEMRVVTPEKVVSESASATCKYNYNFNLTTFERKPIFSCGGGSLGTYKLDASAITDILNGEVPTLGKIVQAVSITPPLFRDANRDEYQNTRNQIISSHPTSIVYFASESFVNWASVENQGANIIASILSGGAYGAELARQIEERLVTELKFMGTFASQTGASLAAQQIVALMQGGSMNLKGYRVSVKVINTPNVIQKCLVNTKDCTPEVKLPRVGFAVIATRS